MPSSSSAVDFDNILAAVAGGAAAGAFTHPLDVIHLRQQLKQKVFGAPHKLRRGIAASIARESTYNGFRAISYGALRAQLEGTDQGRAHSSLVRYFCAGLSGVAGTVVSHPIDLIKVIKVVSPIDAPYTRIYQNLRATNSLMRALAPSLQRSVVFSAAQLGTYDVMRQWLLERDQDLERRVAILAAAWTAGVASTIVSTPIDVAKTRLILSDFNGTVDCLRCIVKYEGMFFLWRGALATWLRLGPYAMIQLVVWESMVVQLRERRSRSGAPS